jgi:DMSO/TMAO reductase YedYZ heme-binding membrane subunit
MEILLAFVIMTAVVLAARNLILKHSWVLYSFAILLSVSYLYQRFFGTFNHSLQAVLTYTQRGLLAIAMFSIVMLIGVLDEASPLKRWLGPTRAQLSITACLLILGHACGYMISYLQSLAFSTAIFKANVMISLAVSMALLLLMLLLGITSNASIRQALSPLLWKKIQRFSYVFYGLIYIHLILMILPSVQKGHLSGIFSLAFYSVIFSVYFVLRAQRALKSRKVFSEKKILGKPAR